MFETMKLSVLTGAIVLGCVLTAAPIAMAQQGPGAQGHSFEELDANSDDKITEAELEAHRADRFATADTDGNGSLSASEMTAMAEQRKADRAARMIERIDADGDGEVSQEELANGGKRRGGGSFDRIDANGDGEVSKAEFDAAKDKRRAFFKNRLQHNDG